MLKEDFGFGNDTCISNVSPNLICCINPTSACGPGKYIVGNRMSGFLTHGGVGSIWTRPNSRSGIANDRFLIIDIGNVSTQDVLYYKDVNDIDTTRKVQFEMYLYNLFRPWTPVPAKPDVEIRLVSKIDGRTLASKQSGPLADHTNPDNWIRFAGELDTQGETSVRIEIRTNAWANWGCDFLVDDIYVYQVPKSCEQEITKQVVVPSGKEFKASVVSITHATCKGAQTGKVTFKMENLGGAGYRITEVNGAQRSGAGYTTEITTPIFEVDGLRAGINTIKFTNRTCSIVRTVTITEPNQLTLTATISEPAMCSNNNKARVTLTAGGGTPPYTYIYQGVGSVTTQTSNVFTGIAPGTPTFIVKDKNGCTTVLSGVFTVTAPNPVIFTTSVTTCYSNNNNGEIAVKITQGNGGYKVKLNNNAAVVLPTNATTHTFTGLTQGSYSITVTDAYGCSSVTQVRIYPSLNSTVKITNQSCKKGKIEVTASGGNLLINY